MDSLPKQGKVANKFKNTMNINFTNFLGDKDNPDITLATEKYTQSSEEEIHRFKKLIQDIDFKETSYQTYNSSRSSKNNPVTH
jgi:hypothetical protein